MPWAAAVANSKLFGSNHPAIRKIAVIVLKNGHPFTQCHLAGYKSDVKGLFCHACFPTFTAPQKRLTVWLIFQPKHDFWATAFQP